VSNFKVEFTGVGWKATNGKSSFGPYPTKEWAEAMLKFYLEGEPLPEELLEDAKMARRRFEDRLRKLHPGLMIEIITRIGEL
jgi:hypothetical protein